jgi:hypothetical protein
LAVATAVPVPNRAKRALPPAGEKQKSRLSAVYTFSSEKSTARVLTLQVIFHYNNQLEQRSDRRISV